ncbi:hypothetical protein KS4_00050 [Poriferisphaera corsica]|uniref:Uncharacterized protein n=1 Tax=Poriferisphaera corsica TaxID=2528020 RepID=A0A517YP22_9BACT|nr:hypothetical protein [Poriferisphaera corsica]QDU31977.1 hypothetical protein KS4_00050 [Poriferisphaera corsica]
MSNAGQKIDEVMSIEQMRRDGMLLIEMIEREHPRAWACIGEDGYVKLQLDFLDGIDELSERVNDRQLGDRVMDMFCLLCLRYMIGLRQRLKKSEATKRMNHVYGMIADEIRVFDWGDADGHGQEKTATSR